MSKTLTVLVENIFKAGESNYRIQFADDKTIRKWKAEAWDECGQDIHGDHYPDTETYLRNPYREETEPVGGIHSNHCDDRGCLGCECDPACDDYEETE